MINGMVQSPSSENLPHLMQISLRSIQMLPFTLPFLVHTLPSTLLRLMFYTVLLALLHHHHPRCYHLFQNNLILNLHLMMKPQPHPHSHPHV